jgi:hypothetical protein
LLAVFAAVLFTAPRSMLACATCFGASDSDLARGMNWGILSLLVVVVGVLSAFATLFVYIARRSAALAARSENPAPTAVANETR